MLNINKVIIGGCIGQNVEFKQSGKTSIANINIATNRRYKDKESGETKTLTEWHKVVAFNKLAEIAKDFLEKGSQVYIEGELRTEKYTDKNNIERSITKIIASDIQLLGSKKEKPNSSEVDNDEVPF